MKPNRYPGTCATCGATVEAKAGILESAGRGMWRVKHLVCASAGTPQVIETRTANWSGTRNAKGICEDAPCCGCCTF